MGAHSNRLMRGWATLKIAQCSKIRRGRTPTGHWHNPRMIICIRCDRTLSGRQTKFCSRQCKNNHTNHRHQSYLAQQKRGRIRKIDLIKLKGLRCQKCGYDRNFSALEFHHRNPVSKLFQLDLRSLSNRRWSVIVEEAKKCTLVCSNCHKELHNPDCIFR